MGLQAKSMHGVWVSRWTFILAATGSAVGLGNMWKFPYVAGSFGGGAFVFVYLLCVFLIGVPLMMAEVLIGRSGRQSPINAMRHAVTVSGAAQHWRCVGWLGVTAGLIILSFYAVIAGWALDYVVQMARGNLIGADGEVAAGLFAELTNNPLRLIVWQTAFLALCMVVVVRGVRKGVGTAVEILMPLLFVMLLGMLVFAVFKGDFSAAWQFLFRFDASSLTWRAILEAMGLAFFTLSIGMGAIMAYGAYMPANASIGQTVLVVALFDSLVAIISGLIIFSIVFATPGIEPSAGPGLMFISLPVAFGNMPGGLLVGAVFFILVVIAAWSSAISLLEPAVAWLMEAQNFSRLKANVVLVAAVWVLGLGTVLSFNVGRDATIAGFTFFDALDFLTANIILPLGGLAISLFTGFAMRKAIIEEQIPELKGAWMTAWRAVLCYVAPFAITCIFVMGIYDKFFL